MHLDLQEQEIELLARDYRYGMRVGTYTIIGLILPDKGKTKTYIIQCDDCAKDPYLYGLGIFAAVYQSIINHKPCACGTSFRCPEEIQYKKIKRLCEDHGFKFNGFHGQYSGVANTKCKIECLLHGESRNCTVKQIIASNRPTCKRCFLKRKSEFAAGTDEECIDKFMRTGKFHVDTIFYRSDRVAKGETGKRYWFMLCGECKTIGESYTSSFTLGYRSCECSRSKQEQAYINLIYNESGSPIALKFGIANISAYRIENQNNKNRLKSKQYEVYQFETKADCLSAEREVKSVVETGILSKEYFYDGYTETTNIKYLVDIQKIYKKHGGVSIMYIENETYFEGCVAFVEEFVFNVYDQINNSPYLRTKSTTAENDLNEQ